MACGTDREKEAFVCVRLNERSHMVGWGKAGLLCCVERGPI